jgi:hypothetical protein
MTNAKGDNVELSVWMLELLTKEPLDLNLLLENCGLRLLGPHDL